jgi:hypothetical protein
MKQPKHKRSKAQRAASRTWAAAGRASQKKKRDFELSHHLPTRSKAQKQASLKWRAAGRAAQSRKAAGLKPLPKHKPALAGGTAGTSLVLPSLAAANRVWPCCTATAIAAHLYVTCGILASEDDIMALHLAAGGEDGAYIPDLLEVASSGFAGTRISRFFPVWDVSLPGIVAGLRLPGGTHAALLLPRGACVSWGSILPVTGTVTEAWHAEWEAIDGH